MNVKNVEKENGSAKVTVEIAKDEFQTALDKAYAKIRKDIMIPGFRKGKAPRKFVERMYGSQVFYEDAVSEIFPDIYEAAIIKQELKAVGQPSVTDMQTPEDGSVVLTVSTELYPEVTLGEYKGIEVPKESVSISKAEVDAELSRMQERNARIETVDREAKTGDTVVSSAAADIKPGNCLPLANIPVGTIIHNIEINPGRGAQLVRSAGDYAQLMAKDAQFAQVRLPSGEVRLVRPNCVAVIGQVGNIDHENVHIGKAGRTRHMGIRPTVRGSVMNPNDHPHGGGEGKSPVGHPGPMTPWGKPAMGLKTRKTKNRTNKYIFKHRNAK